MVEDGSKPIEGVCDHLITVTPARCAVLDLEALREWNGLASVNGLGSQGSWQGGTESGCLDLEALREWYGLASVNGLGSQGSLQGGTESGCFIHGLAHR